ncbi:hypothetical protein HPC49_52585, partial [Pyxidicoccus fallax]
MPKKPLTSRQLDSVLQAPERRSQAGLRNVITSLPEDVDPVPAARAALCLIRADHVHPMRIFARACKTLPVPVIRALLDLLETDRRPHSFFLREYVPRDGKKREVSTAWASAMQALLDLESPYGWATPRRKAKLRGLAGNPRTLQAIQTAAVACEQVSMDMLAVLVTDASEASLDALIPHVERAVKRRDQTLDRLQELRTHARATPVMDDFFQRIQAQLDARQAASPALQFARELGFGELDTFELTIELESSTRAGAKAYWYWAWLHVSSDSDQWFTIAAAEKERGNLLHNVDLNFNNKLIHRDHLGLGTCEPAGFPAWIARAAKKFRVQWNHDGAQIKTSVRGNKGRELLARW